MTAALLVRADDSAVTLAAAAAPEPAVPGAAAVRDSSGDATLEAVLQVVSAGLWTPANSNGFQAALLVQLHFHRDDDPEPLQDLVHTATIVSAVPRGPAARRLLNHQVRFLYPAAAFHSEHAFWSYLRLSKTPAESSSKGDMHEDLGRR